MTRALSKVFAVIGTSEKLRALLTATLMTIQGTG